MMRLLGVGPIDIISTTIMTTTLNGSLPASSDSIAPSLLFAAAGLRLPQQQQPDVEKFDDPTFLWRRLLRYQVHLSDVVGLRTQPAGKGRQQRGPTAACPFWCWPAAAPAAADRRGEF